MGRKTTFIILSAGLLLAYFIVIWIYLVVGRPCSYPRHPIEFNELCKWAGSPIR